MQIEFIEHSKRHYGQPKLEKPKELKSIKQSTSIDYIPKKCTCPIYINGNDVWIKHNDYFSSEFKTPAEDNGTTQSYRLKKYFNTSRTEKFVYADNWGGIILRNEAWLCLKNLALCSEYCDNEIQLKNEILSAVNKVYRSKYGEEICDTDCMGKFYERIAKTFADTSRLVEV